MTYHYNDEDRYFMEPNLLKPTHLKDLCHRYGLSPSKQYGQNYLVQARPIQAMLKAAQVSKTDTIVEVGPGFGILTLAAAPHVKQLIAFEIEKKLQAYWGEKRTDYPNVEIVWGNVLYELPKHESQFKNYKVVANLPYQITSRILRLFLEEVANKPLSITVMVQKEVADRICAKPGEMSLLAVSVQYYGKPKIITKVARGSFWPAPEVDSAVLHIDISPTREGETSAHNVFRVARAGFANKRKQLWRNLSQGLNLPSQKVKEAVQQITGNEKIRAEELGIEQWKQITHLLV